MIRALLVTTVLLLSVVSGADTADHQPLIEIRGNVFFSVQYLLARTHRIRDQKDIENVISIILDRYNNAGFPFCRITPTVIDEEDSPARIILTVDEGPRVIIEDLFFRTTGRTDQRAAKRLANLEKGSYFSRKETERAKKRLIRTNAFETIDESIVHRDGRYYLMLAAREKESDFLTLWGSFSGSSADDIDFGASFSSFNVLGTLRKFDFEYEYQRLFLIKFREPVLIAPAQIDVDFSILTYDSTRLINGRLEFASPIGEYFGVSLLSGIEFVNYYRNDTVTHQSTDNLLGIGLSLDYARSDWSTLQTVKFDYLFRDSDRLRTQYDGEFMLWKFAIRPHYHRVQSDILQFFDYLRIGGAKNIRGYLEDEFVTTRALWCNLEYHRLFIFPLFDVARIGGEIFFSYGFGITAKSRFADASLVLAWPRGGKWSDGKVHLTFAKGL